jgi:hypothetical protein
VSGFPLRGSEPQAMLRLHLPLIEPDGRISRIRLSDQDSRGRTRRTERSPLQPDQAQRRVQVLVREA